MPKVQRYLPLVQQPAEDHPAMCAVQCGYGSVQPAKARRAEAEEKLV